MNRGAQDLARKLDALPYGARMNLARSMGLGADRISHWLAGRGKPNTAQRLAILEAHGVELLAWDDELQEGAAGDAA